MAKPIRAEYYCVKCGRFRPKKDFSLNYNKYLKEYNDGRMLYCNSCAKEISQDIMSSYWSNSKNKDDKIAYEIGIRAICTFFMMPYISKAMEIISDKEMSSIKDKDWNYVYQYASVLAELDVPREYWSELSGNAFMPLDLLRTAKPTSDRDLELFKGLEKDWGKQDCLADYLFLEEKFSIYTEGETLNATMVNMVRYLCQAELDVRKLKTEKADVEKINKAEQRVINYYTKLKLDDFKFNKSKSAQEKLIEDWAFIHENVEPIEWEDENLKDRLGIEEDYDDIMRSNANKVVGTKDYPKITLEDVIKKKNKGRKKK